MPLILLLPLLVAGLFALWVVLLPLAILQRYRHGRARRRVQPWFVRINAWLMVLSTGVFLAVAALLEQWVPDALPDSLVGLAIGACVGLLGLRLDHFEAGPGGLFRTPNRWLLLAMTLLLAARVVIGFWLAWDDGTATGAWGWITRGWLLGVGGVLLGHALVTTWGLRDRLRAAGTRTKWL